MAALGQDLRGANVVFIKTLRQEPIPAKLGFLEGGLIRVLSGYPQDHAANTMEVTCLALSSGAVAVSGFFLFPSDTVDYLAWAQGRRSIAAFLSTLRVHG